jgi:hypothetical protein
MTYGNICPKPPMGKHSSLVNIFTATKGKKFDKIVTGGGVAIG